MFYNIGNGPGILIGFKVPLFIGEIVYQSMKRGFCGAKLPDQQFTVFFRPDRIVFGLVLRITRQAEKAKKMSGFFMFSGGFYPLKPQVR